MMASNNLEPHTKLCNKEVHCNKSYKTVVTLARERIAITLTAFLLLPIDSYAATIALGGISFNTLIPSGGGAPGVTDFEVDNFTGSFALPSDFPVIANLTFQNSELVLTKQGGTQEIIPLGDITPGADTPNSLDFSSTLNFVSAAFTATLSSQTFVLSDGTTFQAASSQISSAVNPSAGLTLSPDVDSSLIVVSGTSVATTIPEPRSLSLAFIGSASILGILAALQLNRRFGICGRRPI
jgi:hypothetical protein